MIAIDWFMSYIAAQRLDYNIKKHSCIETNCKTGESNYKLMRKVLLRFTVTVKAEKNLKTVFASWTFEIRYAVEMQIKDFLNSFFSALKQGVWAVLLEVWRLTSLISYISSMRLSWAKRDCWYLLAHCREVNGDLRRMSRWSESVIFNWNIVGQRGFLFFNDTGLLTSTGKNDDFDYASNLDVVYSSLVAFFNFLLQHFSLFSVVRSRCCWSFSYGGGRRSPQPP